MLCATVIDVYSGRCVGWAIGDHLRSELVVDAREMARWRRKPVGTVQIGLIDRRSSVTRAELASAIFDWIEGLHNPVRCRSRVGYLSPEVFETRQIAAPAAA